jgi:hypothetical protein
MKQSEANNNMALKTKFVYGMGLVIALYHFIANTLFSQLQQPLIIYPDIDNTYWLVHLLNIPRYIIQHPVLAVALDMSLFALPILFLLFGYRWIAILYTLLVALYSICFNSFAAHHYHGLIGLVIMSIPFWFNKEEKFALAWDGARYYFFFVFASAGLWKLFRGSWLLPEHFSNLLLEQNITYIVHNTSGFFRAIVTFFIDNKGAAFVLYLTVIIAQLAFLIGLFTKRFDRFFFMAVLVFFVFNYFIMGIVSFELLVLSLTVTNWDVMPRIVGNVLGILNK